jgi:uncharacterized RDD family membrane protein YckC
MEKEGLEYVGFWRRVGATLIDSILLIAVTVPFLLAVYGYAYVAPDAAMIQGPADFLITYVFPAVAVIAFWSAKQATPGKMAVGAKIVDASTGNAPTTGQLVGRYFAYYLSIIVVFLGFIWVAFDDRKQGWHDKLAGTVVVRLKNRQPREVEFE